MTDLMRRGDVLRDPRPPRLLELLVVGAEYVDVVRLLRQFPDALKRNSGIVPPIGNVAGSAAAALHLTSASVALSILKRKEDPFTVMQMMFRYRPYRHKTYVKGTLSASCAGTTKLALFYLCTACPVILDFV